MKYEKLPVPFEEGTRIYVIGEHECFTRELINAFDNIENYTILDYGDSRPEDGVLFDGDGGKVIYIGKQQGSRHPAWLENFVISPDNIITYSFDVLNYSKSWLDLMGLRREIITEFANMLPEESELKLKLLVILEEAP